MKRVYGSLTLVLLLGAAGEGCLNPKPDDYPSAIDVGGPSETPPANPGISLPPGDDVWISDEPGAPPFADGESEHPSQGGDRDAGADVPLQDAGDIETSTDGGTLDAVVK